MVARKLHGFVERLESRNLLAGDLVADIHIGTASSAPSELTPLGDLLVYTATGRESISRESDGRELWVTDTVTNQTELVADIRPGATGSFPTSFVRFKDEVYFFADDGVHGFELWKTAGTEETTQRVTDLWPENASIEVVETAVSESHLFFIVENDSQIELWRTDGTAPGTHLLTSQGGLISELTAIGSEAYFLVKTPRVNTIWKSESDGSDVFELPATKGKAAYGLTADDEELYYASGEAVWLIEAADRDAQRIADFESLSAHETWLGQLTRIIIVDEGIHFETCDSQGFLCRWQTTTNEQRDFDSTVGVEPSATFSLRPRPSQSSRDAMMADNKDWTRFGDDWIIAGNLQTPGASQAGLWRSDLTEAGTRQIQSVARLSDLGDVAVVGETLYASIELDGSIGRELYRFDLDIEEPTVAFAQASFDVSEDGVAIGSEITITRSSGEGPASVAVRVYHGTAAGPDDFAGYAGRGYGEDFEVRFQDGETAKTVSIDSMRATQVDLLQWELVNTDLANYTELKSVFTLLNDDLYEPVESVFLRLSTSDSDLIPKGQVEAQINIVDDDPKTVLLDHSDLSTDVMIGGAVDTVATSLNFEPVGTVVVKPSYDESAFVVTPEQLEFTAEDWSTNKFFNVQGLNATKTAQLTVSIDAEQTNEADAEAQAAHFEFAIESPIEFEQVAAGLSVANVNPDARTGGLNPRNLTVAGDYLYFTSDTGSAPNVSLWKTNGTAEGTSLVTELEASPTKIVGSDDQLFYLIGDQLWVLNSDTPELLGQDNGRIAEFEQQASPIEGSGFVSSEGAFGFDGQVFAYNGWSQLSRRLNGGRLLPLVDRYTGVRRDVVAVFEDRFYFVAETAEAGNELWVSDGTQPGTRLVADLYDGPSTGVTSLSDAAIFQGELYFAANDGANGSELWRTDADGVMQVFDLDVAPEPGLEQGSDAKRLTKVNDTIYFVADGGSTPKLQLWGTSTDSASASMLVAIPKPETAGRGWTLSHLNRVDSKDLIGLIPYGDEVLFTHSYFYDAAFESSYPIHEFDLWKSDGTGLGTELILPIYEGYYDYPSEYVFVGPRSSAVDASGKLFVRGATYDGTTAIASSELHRSYERLPVDDSQFTRVGDQIFFSQVSRDGRHLFVSTDGLETSTLVSPDNAKVFHPGLSRHGHTSEFVEFGERLFYTAGLELFDRIFVPQEYSPQELWTSDGTPEGTRQVVAPDSGYVANLTVMDEQLFFTTDEPPQLFVTDGTADGTVLLQEFQTLGIPPEVETHFFDVNRADTIFDTSDFVVFEDMLYFAADVGTGRELWRSDGTPEGTELFAEINPEEAGSDPVEFTVVGDRLFFSADDGTHGRELWVTDGTAEGTKLHADLNEGATSSNPDDLLASDDLLYFVADDGIRGREVWRLDTSVVDAEALVGDTNGDAEVNFADFLVLSANFGSETENGASDGDLDGNGLVDFADFLLLSANFGERVSGESVDAAFAE